MNNLGSAGTLEVFVRAPIQPEFVDLVADARAAIASDLGEALDSLYLYGSVARGCARAGFSDLDLTVVLVYVIVEDTEPLGTISELQGPGALEKLQELLPLLDAQ